MHRTLLLAAFCALTGTAQAATVLSDNFDSENGGATALNYTGFANFTVYEGNVDLVANGAAGIACAGGAGSCVDLDGSPGPGRMVSDYFAYNAGDRIVFTVQVSGSQRGTEDTLIFGTNFIPSASFTDVFLTDIINGTYARPDFGPSAGFNVGVPVSSAQPFVTVGFALTAVNDGTIAIRLESNGPDSIGPVIDNVLLTITPAVIDTPAPAALALFGLGVLALGVARRR